MWQTNTTTTDHLPRPVIPLQDWEPRNLPDQLLVAFPTITPWVITDCDTYYRRLQDWLQVSRYWWYVLNHPMVADADYQAIIQAALRCHRDDPEYCPLPRYSSWNYLTCRYHNWVKWGLDCYERRPRWPWVHRDGVYNIRPIIPLDWKKNRDIISSGKKSQPPSRQMTEVADLDLF